MPGTTGLFSIRSLIASLTKRGRRAIYMETLPQRLRTEWTDLRRTPGDDVDDIACRDCPKFASLPPRCTVPMGSRIRSCICAAAEYNLRGLGGKDVLEIGVAERSFGKVIVESYGGRWSSVDPQPGTERGIESIRTHVGHAADLPFPDASFDFVFGIQTLEHWDDPMRGLPDCDYPKAMAEVWRVLRPGGGIYFDAPIHLHGAAPFVRGDLDAIRSIFATRPWRNLRMEAWRRLHDPLPVHRAPRDERDLWPRVLPGATPAELDALGRRSIWLLTIRAEKPA